MTDEQVKRQSGREDDGVGGSAAEGAQQWIHRLETPSEIGAGGSRICRSHTIYYNATNVAHETDSHGTKAN